MNLPRFLNAKIAAKLQPSAELSSLQKKIKDWPPFQQSAAYELYVSDAEEFHNW